MKKVLLALLALTALSLFAHHDPITSFPEGDYLGMGKYTSTNNEEGFYSSYAAISSDQWDIVHYRDDTIYFYTTAFNFSGHGFFSAQVIDYSTGAAKSFPGKGYCGSVQCHIEADFGNKKFELTGTFLPAEGRIYWLGSISSDSVTYAWEESMVNVDYEALNPKQ